MVLVRWKKLMRFRQTLVIHFMQMLLPMRNPLICLKSKGETLGRLNHPKLYFFLPTLYLLVIFACIVDGIFLFFL